MPGTRSIHARYQEHPCQALGASMPGARCFHARRQVLSRQALGASSSFRQANNTMKNTSLSIPLGNAKGIGGLGATPP